MHKSLIGAAVGTALLAGCAVGPASLSTEQRLALTCKSYDSTLELLVAVKPKLSEAQVQAVNEVRAVANPICYQHNIQTAEGALERLERVLARLNGIAPEATHGP